jgi:hypothetical protein
MLHSSCADHEGIIYQVDGLLVDSLIGDGTTCDLGPIVPILQREEDISFVIPSWSYGCARTRYKARKKRNEKSGRNELASIPRWSCPASILVGLHHQHIICGKVYYHNWTHNLIKYGINITMVPIN